MLPSCARAAHAWRSRAVGRRGVSSSSRIRGVPVRGRYRHDRRARNAGDPRFGSASHGVTPRPRRELRVLGRGWILRRVRGATGSMPYVSHRRDVWPAWWCSTVAPFARQRVRGHTGWASGCRHVARGYAAASGGAARVRGCGEWLESLAETPVPVRPCTRLERRIPALVTAGLILSTHHGVSCRQIGDRVCTRAGRHGLRW